MNKPELSVIILSHNTRQLLADCLKSLEKIRGEISFEVVVVDNGSTDGSLEIVKKEFPWVIRLDNKKNLGFAKGNNAAREVAKGKYILFLNSDTVVYSGSLKKSFEFLKERPDVGAMTCKLVLPDGKIDKDIRRRFPTPWVSFNRLILRNGRLYWYEDAPENLVQEVDAIQGAFFLSLKKVLDQVGWFDEDYFLDGEDIDLCWKIKAAGYKIFYYPKVKVLHLKGASKGKDEARRKVPLASRLKFRMASVNSMEIFYRKRLWQKYPLALNLLVLMGIKTLKALRYLKIILE